MPGLSWLSLDIFSCSARAALNADRALPSSLIMRAITPSMNARLKAMFSVKKSSFSLDAIKAFFAAVPSRSTSAQ